MACKLHFVLIPLMTQGHLIPMIDIAKLLAQRDIKVTIVTTPLNAARIDGIISRAVESGLPIHVLKLKFPAIEVGLPDGCESIDCLPSPSLTSKFIAATTMLKQPLKVYLQEVKPSPSCMVSDKILLWTADLASELKIPRILFDGVNCFTLLCIYALHNSKVYLNVSSDSESFVVPGMPDRVEFRRNQLSGAFNPGSVEDLKELREKVIKSEEFTFGVMVNSYEELESKYAEEYRKSRGSRVWCIGPVSLCNTEKDRFHRGNRASIDEIECLKWLDSWPPGSVIYACLGSLNGLLPPQLAELGLGLEATGRPFVWVIRGGNSSEMEKWLVQDKFEERVKGRGLLIRGWAPQVLILAHKAIGGFLTHCGWNSTLEGISAGVAMVTWPMFAEQFYNEKLVVQVLGVGVRVGAEVVVHRGEEERHGVLVKREDVKEAVEKVMDEGKEGEDRRERVRELAEKAKKAMEVGGSSYSNMTKLIEDVIQQVQSDQTA